MSPKFTKKEIELIRNLIEAQKLKIEYLGKKQKEKDEIRKDLEVIDSLEKKLSYSF